MRAPVPCIINNTPYANLKLGLAQENIETTPAQRRTIRDLLKQGVGVQIDDCPPILPNVEIQLI